MRLGRNKSPSDLRSSIVWLGVAALLVVMGAIAPTHLLAQEDEKNEATAEHEPEGESLEEGEESGEEEEFHKNHFAVFLGFTEAVEEHSAVPHGNGHGETHSERSNSGEDDADFTIGLDYERRFTQLFGFGGMFDWVVEGNREFLLGPAFFLHPFGGSKLFAAPLWERVRESGDNELVIRLGAAWEFEVGKYSIAPNVIYDITEEHELWVLGVTIGRGF